MDWAAAALWLKRRSLLRGGSSLIDRMADITSIANYLSTRERCRFAAVNKQVLGSLGGIAYVTEERQASDDRLQHDMDIMIGMDEEQKRMEMHDRFFNWCFNGGEGSCPRCDD